MAIEEMLARRAVKRACIDEEKLMRRKMSLDESIAFLSQVRKDAESSKSLNDLLAAAYIFTIGVTIVTDVVMDTTAPQVEKTNPGFSAVTALYDKARKDKWSNSRYKDEIKKSNKAFDAISARVKNKDMKMAIKVFKNMAANFVGLTGAIEDTRETKQTLVQNIRTLEQQLQKLGSQLTNTEDWLAIGQGPTRQPNMSMQLDNRLH